MVDYGRLCTKAAQVYLRSVRAIQTARSTRQQVQFHRIGGVLLTTMGHSLLETWEQRFLRKQEQQECTNINGEIPASMEQGSADVPKILAERGAPAKQISKTSNRPSWTSVNQFTQWGSTQNSIPHLKISLEERDSR